MNNIGNKNESSKSIPLTEDVDSPLSPKRLNSTKRLLMFIYRHTPPPEISTLKEIVDCYNIIKLFENNPPSGSEKEEALRQIALKIKNLEQIKLNLEKNDLLVNKEKIEGIEKKEVIEEKLEKTEELNQKKDELNLVNEEKIEVIEEKLEKTEELNQKKDDLENEILLALQEPENFIIPSFTEDEKKNKQIYDSLIKLSQYELKKISEEKEALSLYTPPDAIEKFDSNDQVNAFQEVIKFLNHKTQRSLLLLGDAGAGKTIFAHFLAQHLWKQHRNGIVKNQPIPIIIPLIDIVNPDKTLVNEALFVQRLLLSEEIELLKEHVPIIFILEGYDEKNVFTNLFKSNKLQEWEHCKVITCCRSQPLLHLGKEYTSLFKSGLEDDPLIQLILCPFKKELIQEYIHSYFEQHKNKLEWEESLYWYTLSKLPDLLNLASNPFILNMTIQELPQIAEKSGWKVNKLENKEEEDEKIKNNENETVYEKMSLTQSALYDLFIEAWIKRKLFKDKYEENKFIEELKLSDGETLTVKDFLEHNQKIAIDMLTHKTTEFKIKEYKEVLKETKIIESHTNISSLSSPTMSKEVTPNWEKEYLGKDEKSKRLLLGWLLKPKGKDTYVFIHDSLRIHFAAKEICHGILSCSTFAFGHPLNEKLIVDDVDLLNQLVELLKINPSLEKFLVDIIKTSKYDECVEIAAANAITLLNRAGTVFSGCDWLSGVRIPRADLRGGFFGYANFSYADLRGVRFNNTVLYRANFMGACMDNVELGQLPSLKFDYPITKCTYSPDGKWLAVGDSKGYIYLCDVATGLIKTTLKNWSFLQAFENRIDDLCFSHNSCFLALGSRDGLCLIWEIPSGKLLHTLKGHSSGISLNKPISPGVKSVCFNMDGTILASGGHDGTIRLWSTASGKAISCIQPHGSLEVTSVRYHPNKKILATSGNDGTLKLWDLSSGELLMTLTHHYKGISLLKYGESHINFSPSGKFILLNNHEQISLWDVSSGEKIEELEDFDVNRDGTIECLRFSPDGNYFAVAFKYGVTHLWDFSLRKKQGVFRTESTVKDISFSYDNKTMALGDNKGAIKFCDISTLKASDYLKTDPWIKEGHNVTYNSDRTICASTSTLYGERLSVWNISSGKRIHTFKISVHCSYLKTEALNPDGKIIVFSDSKKIRFLDIYTGKQLMNCSIRLSDDLYEERKISFSPVGKIVALTDVLKEEDSESKKYSIQLWELDAKKSTLLGTLIGHTSLITAICFSPDGQFLASASSEDKSIRIWEISSGKELLNFWPKLYRISPLAPFPTYTTLSFDPQGKILAAGSDNNRVILWDLSSNKQLTWFSAVSFFETMPDLFSVDDPNYYNDNGNVKFLKFSGKGMILVGTTKFVKVRDIFSGKMLYEFPPLEHGFQLESLDWDTSGEKIIIGDDRGNINHYQIPKNFPEDPPFLYWSNHEPKGLHCKNTNITLVTGLSPSNRKLLKQHSAIGEVADMKSEEIMEARNDRETVDESCPTVFGRGEDGKFLGLTETSWAVSIAHRWGNSHTFVMIEGVKKEIINGIEKNKRVIQKAEVFLDQNEDKDRKSIKFFRDSKYELGFGYAYVRIKQMTKKDAEALAQECNFSSEPITKEQADELLELIKEDAENTELKYNNFGDSPTMIPFYIKTLDQKYGNCLSYAEGWLNDKTGIGVKFVSEENWQSKLKRWEFTSILNSVLIDQPSDRSYFGGGTNCLIQ
jgi:WD40 repeat protein